MRPDRLDRVLHGCLGLVVLLAASILFVGMCFFASYAIQELVKHDVNSDPQHEATH